MLGLFRRKPPSVDAAHWQHVIDHLPWAQRLDGPRQQRLRELTALFFQQKTITPVGGLQLPAHDATLLAACCCLPLLEFGEQGLHGWSQLLVYLEAFRARRSHVDAAGVLHEWDDELIGEAWEHGPLVLSWADVQADLAEPDAGFCVAVHEMAHKLDALDGVMDGTPPLPRDWQQQWAADFQHAFDVFNAQLDAGIAPSIDPYAAEAPEEFFAVCSEYHFSAPALLADTWPQVAEHLRKVYGRSPFA